MSETNYVMIDLETLSDHANAVILSIGATKFTIENGIYDEFYTNVNPHGQPELGLHVSRRTIDWWATEDKAQARDALKSNRVELKVALEKFAEWYGWKSIPVWSKSVDFDCAIMASAYRAVYGEDATPPWKYYHTRCLRTVEDFYPMPKDNRQGVFHNALDDAKTQTSHLIEFFNKFGMIE
jgi:DNA polymerase III epsilon subunit-like protein